MINMLEEVRGLTEGQFAALKSFSLSKSLVVRGEVASGKTYLGGYILKLTKRLDPNSKVAVITSSHPMAHPPLIQRNVRDFVGSLGIEVSVLTTHEVDTLVEIPQFKFILMEGLNTPEAIKVVSTLRPEGWMLILDEDIVSVRDTFNFGTLPKFKEFYSSLGKK